MTDIENNRRVYLNVCHYHWKSIKLVNRVSRESNTKLLLMLKKWIKIYCRAITINLIIAIKLETSRCYDSVVNK